MLIHAQTATLDLLGGSNAPNCENRSLRFSRFTDPTLKDESRHAFFGVAIQQKCPKEVIDGVRDAHLAFLKSILDAVCIHMENQSRLLLNMAGGVMENAGVSLERFSGMPRIPGSAVKGVARTAAIQQLLDADQKDKAGLLANIALAFGWVSDNWQDKPSKKQKLMDGTPAPREDFFYACPEEYPAVKSAAQTIIKATLGLPENALFPKQFAGLVAFFDALPIRRPQGGDLQLDIVTSHHPKYYTGEMDVALDIESPNPVVFPAIAAHHVFTFAVAPCPASKFFDHELRLRLRDAAKSWLFDGLSLYGIGAKTAAGYGWFEDKTDDVNGAERREAEEKAAIAKAKEDARIYQEAVAEKAKRKEDFDKLSVLEKLEATIAEDVGRFKLVLEKFSSFSLDDQKAVVTWFASGNGKAHWESVISGKKPFKESTWKQVEQAIRKVRKDNNLEKLPK